VIEPSRSGARLRFRLLLALGFGLGLIGACAGGAARPKPVAGGTLALGGERAGSDQPSGPLKVAFSSPEGVVGLVSEVNVVFDRPVHALGVVSQEPAPFRITPAVPGSFRWVGSRAAVFTPERRLPFATAFAVEVPAGLPAIDGTRLAAAHRFEFETRRPSLEGSTPSDGEHGLALDTVLRVELNQVVTPAALRASAKLEMDSGRGYASVAFDVTPDPKQPRALLVRPKRLLSPHSTVVLTLGPSLRSTEGPLPSDNERTVTFRTFDPLAMQEISCARRENQPCEADSSVSLIFNNAVKPQSLLGKLHITPDVGLKLRILPEDGATSYVPLPGRYQAGQSYRLQIDAGVVDEFGQTLGKAVNASFRFADHHPRVDIGVAGRNFAGRPLSVPVASRNVDSFDLLTAALSPQDLLSWREAQRPGPGNLKDLAWLSGFKKTQVLHVSPRMAKNQTFKLSVDAGKVLGQSGRGALAIGARYSPDKDDWDTPVDMKVLNVSDLGISAKLSRFGSLVWVTDRTTNTPVAGAGVELVMPERPSRSYTTDSDGIAHVPAADFAPNLESDSPEARAILVVRRGQDSAFAPVSEFLPGYRLDVPTDFSGELRPYGVLFSDRGLYRPGDEIELKGIVRNESLTGNALPGEKPLNVTLRSPSGDDVATQAVLLTSYGTFSAKLRVPSGGQLGTYSATASGLGKERFLQQSLEVAEYRPVELKVAASVDRPAYLRGDTAKLEVKADYLFGAAAAGLSTTLSVARQPTWFQVPGAEEFSTDASVYYDDLGETSPAGELRRETRKLDEQGRVTWTEKLDFPGQRGTELLRIDAEVTDVSRRSVAGSASALVHPAAFYIGLKSELAGFVDAPGRVQPRVVTLAPDGKRLAAKRVTLELIERRYTYARETSGDDYRGLSKLVDRRVARCEVTTLLGETASCSLAVPAAGYYLIVARAKDERGNLAESALSIYAAGAGEPTWQDSERRSVTLVLDKKSYAVGQRARVLVKSPYKEAEALITVERSGVYHSYRRVLRGTAPSFDIPVTEELRPNAFVGVHLLPRRTGTATPLEPGSYRVGYANLLVDSDARRLAVRVTANKADFRPGEKIDVKLSVKDARGAAAPNTEVTLYAADEGVLSLIDYKTPDPLPTFSAARALQVATLESRDAEGRILLEALAGADKGRDGGGGGERDARRDFRPTAYFNPRIITDARGEAKVSFKLPESLTTYRLMAVAVGQADRYGFTQERVTTSKPLMARPALPRFVRAGDSFEAGVIVSKKGMPAGRVRVALAVTGLTTTSALTRELDVPENGSVEVRFPVRAEHPQKTSLRFEVTAGGERDVVTQAFPVNLPMTPEVAAVYGHTTAAQSEKLGELSAARDDAGGLSVALSSTALVGIDQAALDLIDYPYNCTEQLASRILPLVALGELAKGLGFALPADARRRAEAAVAEVLARQQGDGGFAMWPESEQSSPWVSPYAALALSRAARAGVKVPKPAVERARDYLRAASQELSQPWQLATAALALDVLGELGAPDAGGINRLFLRRKELPLFGKALLLHAAVGAKLASDVPSELTRELEASLHVNGDRALVIDDGGDDYHSLFDSKTRTQAMVLRALAARGKHPLLSELARGLLGSRKQGKFRTTQEGAWALLALDDYRRVAEAEAPHFEATLSLAGQTLGTASFKQARVQSQRFELPLASLLKSGNEPLVFEKRGSGKLFYEARLRYVRKELPKQPLDVGFFVEKSLHSVNAGALAKGGVGAPAGVAREVAAGDLVLVDLTVVTPAPREYVVLDDALPAGLEAVDPKLFTTADWLKSSGFGDDAGCIGCSGEGAGEDAPGFRAPVDRTEVRDDRVLFFVDRLPAGLWHYRYLARATTLGHFVLPPTRVEEMYEPEVFGRTGATAVTVR
jgi:alpha-2-macroglobulin